MSATILCVDDEPDFLLLYTLSLELAGYTVSTAVDGAEGYDRARRLRPDVIVLDCMMPVLDGLGCARRLQADPTTADLVWLFVTARDDIGDEVAQVGAVAYVTKPIDLDEFLTVIDTVLAGQPVAERYRPGDRRSRSTER